MKNLDPLQSRVNSHLLHYVRKQHETISGEKITENHMLQAFKNSQKNGLGPSELPSDVFEVICSCLNDKDKKSITKVWFDRLSPSSQKNLLGKAARSFGFSSMPEYRKLRLSSDNSESLLEDKCLLWLLLGDRDPKLSIQDCPNSRRVAMQAVEYDGLNLQYVTSHLRTDREIVLRSVNSCGYALRDTTAELQADREVVLRAVRRDGGSLKYANTKLRADREIVLSAVENDAASFVSALQFASPELKADKEVVLRALGTHSSAFLHASLELHHDSEVLSHKRLAEQRQSVALGAGAL